MTAKKEENIIIHNPENNGAPNPDVPTPKPDVTPDASGTPKGKKEEQTTKTIKYHGQIIIVEPHELGARVVLATAHGTYITEAIGEPKATLEKVKAYAENGK